MYISQTQVTWRFIYLLFPGETSIFCPNKNHRYLIDIP